MTTVTLRAADRAQWPAIENLQQLIQDGISSFAIQGLTMIVITIILFATNVVLATWTVALIVPLLVGFSLWFHQASEK